MTRDGLLRRFAPLRKRFAFVAGNDGWILRSFVGWAKRSVPTITFRSVDGWWARFALPTLPIRRLRRAHLHQKLIDRAAQHAGLVVEFTGVRQHLGRRLAGR